MENKWARWYEADCIRRVNTDWRVSPMLPNYASVWMRDWTLYGKLHHHKVVTGRAEELPSDWTDWYKNSWDTYLHTDPECVRMKKIFDFYGIGDKN